MTKSKINLADNYRPVGNRDIAAAAMHVKKAGSRIDTKAKEDILRLTPVSNKPATDMKRIDD